MLTLRFLKRLRPLQKFESVDALIRQMQQDTEQTVEVATNQANLAHTGSL
jgi:FAD synthase